jgi:uncharacterized protein YdeI (YjbR/CyaY-like superfamily)
MTQTNPKVDAFIERAQQWQAEYRKLRAIALDCPLTEDLKWGVPCYSYENSNVVLIHGFKNYCAMLFVKGALLPDPQGILITQTENTQSSRQVRFTSVAEIAALEPVLKDYLLEAIAAEKAGLKVAYKKTSEFHMPEEFEKALASNPDLTAAFESLTPGRQRAYLLYFAAPKQAKTREGRVEKMTERILRGKGLED